MNKEKFFIKEFDKKSIRTFNSSLLFKMNEEGVVTLDGSDRTSFKFTLKVAQLFCPYITYENNTPSIETVLSGLMQIQK